MASGKYGKVTWAQMVRDVLIESMRKGQLPLLSFFFVCVLMIWKTPDTYIEQLWGKIFERERLLLILSIASNALLGTGWFIHARVQRRLFKEETQRLVDERNKLQGIAIGDKIETSKD